MNQKETEEGINRFIDYMRSQIELVEGLKTGGDARQDRLYKKILFVALLDSMSRTVFPRKGNRERFVGLIKSFANWKEGHRVSLPHLVQLLAKAPDPRFSEIRALANSRLDKWAPGEIVTLERDPSLDELIKLWPMEKEHRYPIGDVQLESCQHWHLMYTYRNGLIHEFRA